MKQKSGGLHLLRHVLSIDGRSKIYPIDDAIVPVLFDGCAGWLHRGEGAQGVLLCGPIGAEADYAHRSWWELARSLAAQSGPTLRFDYLGTRDSAPLSDDQDPTAAWIGSLKAAAAWLREHCGCETISIVGLRLGATLAALAAAEMGGVSKLVLLAPLVDGEAYFRERNALTRLSADRTGKQGGLQRFREDLIFSAAAEQALGTIDLRKLPSSPARETLIVRRSGSEKDVELAQHIRSLGGLVAMSSFDDYGALMVNPEDASYPKSTFEQVLNWLGRLPSVSPPRATKAAHGPTSQVVGRGIQETNLMFRPEAPLFGVLCTPRGPQSRTPAVIFLNTGAIGRAGMGGIWVAIARQLAKLGIASLRFDVSGIGDSPSRPGQRHPYRCMEEAVLDASAAIDWMVAQGYARVSLVGFCWGAQLACNMAYTDERIDRLVLVNPRRRVWDLDTVQAPMTRGRQRVVIPTLSSLMTRWKNLVQTRRGDRNLARVIARRAWDRLIAPKAYPDLSPPEVARKLAGIKDRGIETLWIQGREDPLLKEFEELFQTPREDLGDLLKMTAEFPADADHLFRTKNELKALSGAICNHLLGQSLPSRARKSA